MPGARPEVAHSFMYPNRTIYNVETPDCHFRRFTPDGKFLIGFNRLLSGLQVFRVVNASPSTEALVTASTESGKGEFWQVFRLAWARTYTGIGESLHRDLCLVMPNMKHLIVGRIRRADPGRSNAEQTRNATYPNALSCVKPVEDISLLVIDIHTGKLIDTRTYHNDVMYLSGHNGISVLEDRICLLSLKNQCLHILRVENSGKLTHLREIGWYAHEDDAIYEETLRIREARALARRLDLAKHKRSRESADGPGRCVDEASGSAPNKRRRIDPRADPQATAIYPGAASSSQSQHNLRGATGGYAGEARTSGSGLEPLDTDSAGHLNAHGEALRRMTHDNHDIHCPDASPPSARWPRANTQDGTEALDRRPPFIFPFSQTTASEGQQDASAPSEDSDRVTNSSSGGEGMAPADSSDAVSPFLAFAADRAAIMSLYSLRGLPPQYRLMLTRAIHPSMRLDSMADNDISVIEPSLTSTPYGGLRQRLLGALFMRAKNAPNHSQTLHYFFRSFRQYEGLVLWRAQFVTPTRMLLRFVPLLAATSRTHMPRLQAINSNTLASTFSLLAEYDITEARFGRIWDTEDPDLYEEVERRLDVYRAPMAARSTTDTLAGAQTPSLSNDLYLRDAFESTQAMIRAARSGGLAQAVRKASVMLPFAPQYVQESPLLNPMHFQCNLRTRQTMEKFRPVSLAPIRFYDRKTGTVKFVLSPTPDFFSQRQLDEFVPPAGSSGTTLRSGAVIVVTGGTEELSLVPEINSGGSGNPHTTPSIPPTGHAQQGSGHKAGIVYLFHPTLPLVLSTRNDRGAHAPIPTSNIHFHSSAC
ncbi:hypothetical protein GGF46_000395 [Coemansia sp. RSA 552]|nr:hypothetical protein GGF46_000395 [Coemansia sp. RSA 552]